MNINISQDKTVYFLNNYFKQFWFKLFIFQEISWILLCYFGNYYILSSIILSFVTIISSFLISKFLHKENLKSIVKFYDKNNIKFKNNKKNNKEITVICNLKKFNGPTFGALTFSRNSLIFTPLKERNNNEKFVIDNIKEPNVHISALNTRTSWINKVFFKGNIYCLEIKWNNKKAVLQMPNDDSLKSLFE